MTNEESKLYNDLKKQVKKSNQRILEIERLFGQDKWAVRQIRNELDTMKVNAWTKSGRVRLNTSMTFEQLKAIEKATNKFLKSKHSSLKGIKETIKATKAGFKENLGSDITDKEIDEIYEGFEDSNVQWITGYIAPSAFWHLVREEVEQKARKKNFYEDIFNIIDETNNRKVKQKLSNIYNKYIKGKMI